MVSQQVNQPRFAQFAAEVLSDTAGRLLPNQYGIADTYLRRSGDLADKLSSPIYTVVANDDGANLTINYPAKIRFLDLKKTRRGRLKKVYYPIYNRPVYGYIYGYALARLRAALNSNVREALAVEGTLNVTVTV